MLDPSRQPLRGLLRVRNTQNARLILNTSLILRRREAPSRTMGHINAAASSFETPLRGSSG